MAVRLARRSPVPPLNRLTRTLVAIAALSFLVIVLAYLLAPADRAARTLVAAVLIGAAVASVGVRFTYSLRANRRYATLLENEVASQTPSLRDSLAAIAALLYAPVRESGAISRVLILARDVTDQRRSESQYQQAEKLAALGHLVSGVAHEINNPAAIISGFAQTLLLDELKPEHRDMLQMIYDEATRIGRITSSLLAFARAGGKQRNLVDLNDIARRTFALRSYHLS